MFVGVAVDWARPGAAGSTESVHPLPACSLAPRYLPRWVLEYSTTLEDSPSVTISVTKVIPALTPDRHLIPASCSHSISHSWKENPSRVSSISSRLSVLGGMRGGYRAASKSEKPRAAALDHPLCQPLGTACITHPASATAPRPLPLPPRLWPSSSGGGPCLQTATGSFDAAD